MSVRLRYRVGDETDPWGRTELVVDSDSSTRLEHTFPSDGGTIIRTGRIELGAFDTLWTGLNAAGFPTRAVRAPTAGKAPRRLTMEENGGSTEISIGWPRARSLRGYAEAFDVLDGVVRELSGGAVDRPTTQHGIVHDIVAVAGTAPAPPRPRRAPRTPSTRTVRVVLAIVVVAIGAMLVYQPFRKAHELHRHADMLRRTGEQVQASLMMTGDSLFSGQCQLSYDVHGQSYAQPYDCGPDQPAERPLVIWVNPDDPQDFAAANGDVLGDRLLLSYLLAALGGVLILASPGVFVNWAAVLAPASEPEPAPARRRPVMRKIRAKRSRRRR